MSTPQMLDQIIVPGRALVTDAEPEILRFALDAPGQVVLVTLVEVRGGAARAVGAQMAVRADGSFCGYVSGGCTEAAVAAEALVTLERGSDRFLKLGEGSPFFDIVLPCSGGLTLVLHLLRHRQPIADVLASLAGRRACSLSYDPASQSLAYAYGDATQWQDGTFHRAYRPGRRLALAGRGIELECTAQVAEAAGFEVVDLSSDLLDEETSVAILMHDLDQELPLLETALTGQSRYIGALGSRKTHERRCAALARRGHSSEQIARIKGPIGLFGPTRDAPSLALSILADIAQ